MGNAIVICKYCGREFEAWSSQNHKYCGKKCAGLASRNKIIKACEQCGKEFKIWPSNIKQGGGKHCSKQCLGLAKRHRVTVACKQCGKKFETTSGHIKQGGGKHCSKRCRGLAKRNRVINTCKQCGRKFTVELNKAKKGGGKYCSKKCKHLAQSGPNWHLFKDGHCYDRQGKYQSPEWKRLAKQIRKFDDYTCLACGERWKKGMRTFIVHHFDEDYENDAFLNLLTLCPSCHSKIHRGSLELDNPRA